MPLIVPDRHSLYVGLQLYNKSARVGSTPTVEWENSKNRGYDFIISEFVNQKERDRDHQQIYEEEYTYSVLYELSSNERKNCLIIELSFPTEAIQSWGNNHNSTGGPTRWWDAFRLDVDWVLHAEPYAILLPCIPHDRISIEDEDSATKSDHVMEYISEIGRILDNHSVDRTRSHLYIRVKSRRWKDWVLLRNSLPGAITRISILLHLDGTEDLQVLKRWFAEPLSVIYLDFSLLYDIFQSFRQEIGRPSKKSKVVFNHTENVPGAMNEHSALGHVWMFLVEAIKKGFQICIGEVNPEMPGDVVHRIPGRYEQSILDSHSCHSCIGYEFQVLKQLIRSIPACSVIEKYIMDGFADHLQIPLQPLKDNLDNGTYEVFESDKVKYDLYRDAIFKRMNDIANGFPDSSRRSLLVCIAGAGRGGLLDACIEAHDNFVLSRGICFDLNIVAVEKNYNAYRTLKARWRFTTSWKMYVSDVILSDIRAEWKSSVFPFDIVVSELLGSWGDNEGAPECLPQSVLRKILKTGGIAIPESYTSSVQPVMCPVNWYNSRFLDPDHEQDMQHIHCPLVVVYMTRKFLMSSPVDLFHFSSEQPGTLVSKVDSQDNIVTTLRSANGKVDAEMGHLRSCNHHTNSTVEEEGEYIRGGHISSIRMSRILHFTVNGDSDVHGLEGYFSAILYSDIVMSTDPRYSTPDMVSWFPVLLPFAHPVHVVHGDQISVWISRIRCGESRRLWYEWAVLYPTCSVIHNKNGCDSFVAI